MHVFEGNTADEVWLMAASALEDAAGSRVPPGRADSPRELFNAAFTIRNPRQRWILSRQPAMNPAFAIAEVVWIVSGRRDAAFLNYWSPKLPEFAGRESHDQGAYGFRLRKHLGLAQLERAYAALRQQPGIRQVVLQIRDFTGDGRLPNGRPANPDRPSICSFAKVRAGKLEWTQLLQSNDLFLGVPHNFAQFTLLQEILAAWLGLEVGAYRHIADCLQLQARHEHLRHAPHPPAVGENTDALRFTKPESDVYFAELGRRMDQMTNLLLTKNKLRQLARAEALPPELRNWLLLVAADSARRRRWLNLAAELMAEGSNPALKQLWERWLTWWGSRWQEEVVSEDALICVHPWRPRPFAPNDFFPA
jgi:thymidylate synthase